MTSHCLDRKEVPCATWRVHSIGTCRPAGGDTGCLAGRSEPISNCPLDRVLTYKTLIYLLKLQFCFIKVEMMKSAKNIQVPVIENVIILGLLLVINTSRQLKMYKFKEISHIFTLCSLQMKFINF